MTVLFTCPHCQTQTSIDPKYAGQQGPCATCGKLIEIPATSVVANDRRGPTAVATESRTGANVLYAVLGIIGFLGLVCGSLVLAWIFPAYTYNTPAGQTAACSANLTRIAVAMEEYRAEHGTYPPAYVADKDGKPMHSWRVLLLPYLGEHSLYAMYNMNEPWNGPVNSTLAGQMPAVFGCPADTAVDLRETSYMLVTGPGTAFENDKMLDQKAIKDGAARTLLVVEVANSSVNWMEPRDLDVGLQSWQINVTERGLGSHHRSGGIHAIFADGKVRHLRHNTPSDVLRDMASIDGGEAVDPVQWTE